MKARYRRAQLSALSMLTTLPLLAAGGLLMKDAFFHGALAQASGRPGQSAPASGEIAAPASLPATVPDETVLARVDGAPITQRDVRLAMEELGDRLPRVPEDSRQDYVLSYLIDLWLGSRAAVAEKLDTTPEFEHKAAYSRNKLLLDELLAHETRKAVTPEAAEKTYQQTLKDVKPEEEIRARHILAKSEASAKAALAQLKAGAPFATVAATMSIDPGAAKSGGELGWFSRDRMAPEFSDVAFRLKIGEVSGPVKTQFGWHIIQLEERRTRPVPPFEEVKPEVEAYLARKAQQDLMLGLRSKARIERFAPPVAIKNEAPAPAVQNAPASADSGKPAAGGKSADTGKPATSGKPATGGGR